MQTATVYGSFGYVCFRRDTGEITEREGYENIKRIDVEEWYSHYGEEMPDDLDILDVGFYTHDGHYEPPMSDFRKRSLMP